MDRSKSGENLFRMFIRKKKKYIRRLEHKCTDCKLNLFQGQGYLSVICFLSFSSWWAYWVFSFLSYFIFNLCFATSSLTTKNQYISLERTFKELKIFISWTVIKDKMYEILLFLIISHIYWYEHDLRIAIKIQA